jgi:hypothetical protein
LLRTGPAAHNAVAMRIARRILIAIGSLTMAWLAVGLVGGALVQAVTGSAAAWTDPRLAGGVTVIVVVLGGFIYRDIVRRESPRAADGPA